MTTEKQNKSMFQRVYQWVYLTLLVILGLHAWIVEKCGRYSAGECSFELIFLIIIILLALLLHGFIDYKKEGKTK